MSKTRLNIDLSEHQIAVLEDLMRVGGVATKKDLFNNALTLLEWAMREVHNRRIIASVDEKNERYREFQMPILSHAASATYAPMSEDPRSRSSFA